MPLLEVNDLVVDFGRHRRVAVDHVSWSLEAGERLGLIGESGSGKSVTALAIMGLLPRAASVPGGAIIFEGRDLLGLPERQLQPLRGATPGSMPRRQGPPALHHRSGRRR